jgi:hypothetical protein
LVSRSIAAKSDSLEAQFLFSPRHDPRDRHDRHDVPDGTSRSQSWRAACSRGKRGFSASNPDYTAHSFAPEARVCMALRR